MRLRSGFSRTITIGGLALFCGAVALVRAEEQSPVAISREVKEVFEHCKRAVVKIRAVDEHGTLSGTGFFIDPAGTIFTAYSVGGDADYYTIELDGKEIAAHPVMADRRSGIAILKIDTEAATPALPFGHSKELEVATPVLAIGYPLDFDKAPSYGMIAGFDRKYLGRYFATTHLRVNMPTQRGEAGAPLLNFKGEVVGILVMSIDSGACHALPIDAAEKIRSDFVRFGEVRHGWVGINVGPADKPAEGSRAEFTDIMPNTPAAECGAKPGDILLQVGKTPVHEPEDVLDASFFITAGEPVPITVMRGDQKMTFTVEAGFHPASQKPPVVASPLTPNQGMPLSIPRTP